MMYESVGRNQLEYVSSVWNPKSFINQLLKILRCAIKLLNTIKYLN